LGVLKVGGAYVPLDPTYPEPRLSLMLDDAQPLVVLVHASTRDRVPACAPVLVIDQLDGDDDHAPMAPARGAAPDDLAYVMYTSGSTGVPKGVMVRHRSIVNFLSWFTTRFSLGPGDRVLQLASMSFDSSLRDIFGPLIAGATV